MYIPPKSTEPAARVRHAKYATRSLRAAGHTEEAKQIAAAGSLIRQRVHEVEPFDDALAEAYADRDATDHAMDTTGQPFRLAIGSRTPNGMQEKPYTDIFHNGSQWVFTAPIDENAQRYNDLLARAKAHLAADDPALKALETDLPPLLAQWEIDLKQVDKARTDLAIALAAVDAAEEDYDVQVEKVVGALIVKIGKEKTRRLFKAAS